MTAQKTNFQVIAADEIPEYPIEAGERLKSHFFVSFHFNRWLNSAFRLKASPAVRGLGLDLFFIAQNQSPVGTLPDDDEQLSALLNIPLKEWNDMRQREISPLYKWGHCRCGGEIRLMHPVVTEIAVEALTIKRRREETNAANRERKRMGDLVERIGEAGSAAMAKDVHLVERVRQWLEINVEGSWTKGHVIRALEVDGMRL